MDDDRLYKAAMEQGSVFNKTIYYVFNLIEKPAKVFKGKCFLNDNTASWF